MGSARALSLHEDHPYIVNVEGQEYRVNYFPSESDTGMFGGNSNWRGPIWMPVNTLLIRALCPTTCITETISKLSALEARAN
jgi:hypothetical protein